MESCDTSFDEFYRTSRDQLAVQIAALTGDPVEAIDHVQEAFIRAWGRWDRVRQLDDPAGWVRHVARNLAVSRWRRARRTVLRQPYHWAHHVERRVEFDNEQEALIEALRSLPRVEREAIVLHHLAGLSVAEVATELGAPAGTVKSWLSRGRSRLADELRTPATEELTP